MTDLNKLRQVKEYKQWQNAHNQARKIFEGELIIDPDHTWFDEGQQHEAI